jgi:DedD protein
MAALTKSVPSPLLESLVKERLTGAIILVVLIVLLVPELLSGPSRSAPASHATPAAPASSEEPPLRSYTIDLADESHSATPSAGTSGAAPQPSGPAQPPIIEEHTGQDPAQAQQPNGSASLQPPPQASEAPQQPVQPSPPQAVAPPRPQPQVPAQPARQAPTVAQHSSDKPPAPQQRSAAAEKHPSPERAEKSGGWTVQVGVFAKQANAERLVRELQEQGFRTSIAENTSSGRTLWWVRTTPVAERATAEQLSARLRAAGHLGSVVPK